MTQDYSPYASVTQMLKDLEWTTLKDRRRDTRLALMYQIVKGEVAVSAETILIPADTRTRRQHQAKFKHLSAKTEQYKTSFFPSTIPEWNCLTEACVNAPDVGAFKAQLCAPVP